MKTISFDKYEAVIYERENLNNYPNHKSAVKYIRKTPKAKYLAEKIINHYVYKSEAEALQSAGEWLERIKTNIISKNKEKEERRAKNKAVNASDFYKIGDIICNSWGYEQTNIKFFKVVRVNPKTIDVIEVGQKVVEGSHYSHGMACEVVPNIDVELTDKYTLRVKSEGYLSNPNSYYYMHRWNGKPEYKSWYY